MFSFLCRGCLGMSLFTNPAVRCAPVLAVLAVMHMSCLLPDYCCLVCNCYCPCLTILVSIVLVLVFCLKLSLFLLEKLSGYSIVRSSLFCCVLYLTKSSIVCHFFNLFQSPVCCQIIAVGFAIAIVLVLLFWYQ